MTDPLERRLRDALAMDPVPLDEQRARAAAEMAVTGRSRRLLGTGGAVPSESRAPDPGRRPVRPPRVALGCAAAALVLLGGLALVVIDRRDRGVNLAAGDARPAPSTAPQPEPDATLLPGVATGPPAPFGTGVAPPPSPAPTPVRPPTPGAPQFRSASGDASAGRITVRFDRPVVAGSTETGPNGGNAPKSVLTAMSLIVFGADSRCSSPQGNAHEYLAGVGTDTITTDATSMAPGTTYIGIGAGFVKSAADGTPNDSVQLQGGAAGSFFGGMTCIPIKVSGAVPTIPPPTEAVGGPELLSASGDGVAGRMTLHFSRPVVPGDGPNVGRPNAPPSPDATLTAMQLVVYETDSTCSAPNGNAHQYLSGVGTDTITTDATSLVVGTTYISVGSGFAKSADDGKAMHSVRCLAVKVTG